MTEQSIRNAALPKSGTLSPNPWDLTLSGQNGRRYNTGTRTEDRAPQGCDPSAASGAGMAGRLRCAAALNTEIPTRSRLTYCGPKLVLTQGSTLDIPAQRFIYRKVVELPQGIVVFFGPAFATFVPKAGSVYRLDQLCLGSIETCEVRFAPVHFSQSVHTFYKKQMRAAIEDFQNDSWAHHTAWHWSRPKVKPRFSFIAILPQPHPTFRP
jgi:hypothetical protein